MKYVRYIILLFLFSCQGQDEVDGLVKNTSDFDYLIFGQFYGFCVGEKCVEIYMLTDSGLYEDTNDQYPNSHENYDGSFVKLDKGLFDQVEPLKSKIPEELFDSESNVIGQPDAGDWGGIYLEVSHNGKIDFWLIDKMRSNLPDYLITLVDEIENDIELINQ